MLANEQVSPAGLSWRSGARVETRELDQWFFRLTAFREQLLDGLVGALRGAWPKRVCTMQRHWIGKSTGTAVRFPVTITGEDAATVEEEV